jgi:hypothetical protein
MLHRVYLTLLASFALHAHGLVSSDPCSQLTVGERQIQAIGIAIDPKTQQILYCEFHFELDRHKRVVEYRNLNNQLIVSKTLDFSPGGQRPWVYQEDFRNGELRVVESIDDEKGEFTDKLFVRFKKANSKSIKQKYLSTTQDLVIDAGFDESVKVSWGKLISGDTVTIDFLSPVHLRKIKLSIATSSGRLCEQAGHDWREQVCFLIRPANSLLKAFVKPLVLIYGINDKKLVTYSGSVNLVNDEGSTWKAIIHYRYP